LYRLRAAALAGVAAASSILASDVHGLTLVAAITGAAAVSGGAAYAALDAPISFKKMFAVSE
jgi:hypothetical protein